MQRWKKIAGPLAAAILALVVVRIAFRTAVDMVATPTEAATDRPTLVMEASERPVLIAPTDTSVRAAFPVSNDGRHRLVVNPIRRPCCDPPGPPPLILEPGQSGELIVEAPARELLERGHVTQGFGTNDPRRPELWLTLRLANEPTPAPRPADASTVRPGRSVLVKRPATASAPASGPFSQ